MSSIGKKSVGDEGTCQEEMVTKPRLTTKEPEAPAVDQSEAGGQPPGSRLIDPVRKQGIFRVTLALTLFAVALSLALSSAIFAASGAVMGTRGFLVALVVPLMGAPLTVIWLLRLVLRLSEVEERHRKETIERRNAELSLRESEARFRALFEQSDDIIVLHDFSGRIVMANPAARRSLDLDPGEVAGQPLRAIGDYPQRIGPLEELEGEGAYTFETRLSARGEQEFEASATVDHDNELVQLVLRDITDHKHVERALREARDASEEANKLKSRFVSNVSHDLRTPLNGIIGFAEAVLTETSLSGVQDHATKILKESESLLGLLNDLLDLAKIEAGKMELDLRPIELVQLAASAISPFKGQSAAKNIELLWEVRPKVPRYVRGDYLRLRQVLLNLLSNAIKFTREGSVELTIAPMERDDGAPQLMFAVTDTGIGIEKNKQEAIFESFVQADPSTTRRFGGTGLGTTISKQLVQLMEGQIGLFSIPNQGSTFWFTIPRIEVSEDEISQDSSLTASLEGLVSRPGRILLAEDYPTNQAIARLQLEGAGHSVEVADNGEEALQRCKEKTFDLILMDLQMPVMDGQQATRKIRALGGGNAKAPILAMTASAETSTRRACLLAGMNDIIIKPLRRNELLSLIDQWLCGVLPSPTPSVQEGSGRQEADSQPPLDYKKALDQFTDNRSLLEATLTRFLEKAREDLMVLDRLLRAEEHEDLRKEAHKLRGAAAYLAAAPLSEAAGLLEEAAEERDTEGASRSLATLHQELSRLRQHVEG